MKKTITSIILMYSVITCTYAEKQNHKEMFDTTASGKLPSGWLCDASPVTGVTAQWHVEAESITHPQQKVLSLSKNNSARGIFNLCWTDRVSFRDGELSIRIRANQGRIDQGGGLIWRVKNNDNYYIARYNPLENNFRLYHVINGQRTQLASAENIAIPSGQWFQMRIVQQNQKIQGFLNNKYAWEVLDTRITEAGGVGVWTKADAASSFDDLVILISNPDK